MAGTASQSFNYERDILYGRAAAGTIQTFLTFFSIRAVASMFPLCL